MQHLQHACKHLYYRQLRVANGFSFATICNHLQQHQTPIHKGFQEDVANVANETRKNCFRSEDVKRILTLSKLYGVSLKR
ncbi:MAG: hypothetical protein ACRCX5_00465, partial [Bacteroidales bacterium]